MRGRSRGGNGGGRTRYQPRNASNSTDAEQSNVNEDGTDSQQVTYKQVINSPNAASQEVADGTPTDVNVEQEEQSTDQTQQQAKPVVAGRVYVGNLPWTVSWQDLKDHMRQAGNVERADVFLDDTGRSKGCGIVEYNTAEEALNAIKTLNDSSIKDTDRLIFVREDREDRGFAQVAGRPVVEGVAVGGEGRGAARGGRGGFSRGGYSRGRGGAGAGTGAGAGAGGYTRGGGGYFQGGRGGRGRGRGGGYYNANQQVVNYNSNNTNQNNNDQVDNNVAADGNENGGYGVKGKQIFVGNLPYNVSWQDLKDKFRPCGNVIRADILLDISGNSKGSGTVLFETRYEANRAISTFDNTEFGGRIMTVHEDKFA